MMHTGMLKSQLHATIMQLKRFGMPEPVTKGGCLDTAIGLELTRNDFLQQMLDLEAQMRSSRNEKMN